MRYGKSLLVVVSVSLVGAVLIWIAATRLRHTEAVTEYEATNRPLVATSIVASGQILGIGIGSTIDEARAKLDPLRRQGSGDFRDKESGEGEEGRKFYWRLGATEYDWIIIQTTADGRVVQISANLRPENHKPFSEIGALSDATLTKAGAAIWTKKQGDKPNYRVVAKGLDQKASVIQIVSIGAE